jgi:saposin
MEFYFLAVLLFTTSTWAYPGECSKGPKYWCRDASTAADCGAVRHCQKTVWLRKGNNIKSTATSEQAQMFCNALVQASSELLTNGFMDIKSIKQYLRNDCTKLSDNNNLIRQVRKQV